MNRLNQKNAPRGNAGQLVAVELESTTHQTLQQKGKLYDTRPRE
jgi:hypothetical protein